jgi:hypothetical protein
MVADTGERYLSAPLYENIPAGMTDEEKKIVESTIRRLSSRLARGGRLCQRKE